MKNYIKELSFVFIKFYYLYERNSTNTNNESKLNILL